MTRLTRRDIAVLRDLALSHLVTRDQLLDLGYFSSITRVNTRMRELTGLGLVRRLDSPFINQTLYMVTRRAAEIVGENVSRLIEGRAASPRFVQHALSVTNVRIALGRKAQGTWRFEQQLWRQLHRWDCQVRPDGLFLGTQPTFLEVDMGHHSRTRFKDKLLTYQALAESGQAPAMYGFSEFRVLAVTTGGLRCCHLRHLLPADPGFEFRVQTFQEVGAHPISPWS